MEMTHEEHFPSLVVTGPCAVLFYVSQRWGHGEEEAGVPTGSVISHLLNKGYEFDHL